MALQNEKKAAIRERYKGVDPSLLEVIPATAPETMAVEDRTLNVAAYIRVSTDNDEQTSSFELQQNDFTERIQANPKWNFVGIYSDEGISGTELSHRKGMLQMLEDCRAGKIDYILAKSIARFARNVVDCLSIIEELKNMNPPVGVYFEADNLYTLDSTGALVLTIMATLAEEESRNKSVIMNWSIDRRFSRGIFLTPELLGYDRDENGELVINPQEAETVKVIYDLYINGWTPKEIADLLTEYGRKTKLGNEVWNPGTIRGVIGNERHCGDILARKTYTPNFKNHKAKKNEGKRTQYRQRDHHDPIVSREVYNAANHLAASRTYGSKRKPLPVLSVIDGGMLAGYVPVDKDWKGFSTEDYRAACESVDQKEETVLPTGKRLNMAGFQIVRSDFFPSTEDLKMTISQGNLRFSTSCLRKFEDVEYVELLLNTVKNCIAIRPCSADCPNAIHWGRLREEKWIVSSVGSRGLSSTLFDMMNWEEEAKYRFKGQFISRGDDKLLLFQLDEPVVTRTETQVVVPDEPETDDEHEEIVMKETIRSYPASWLVSFGTPITFLTRVNRLEQTHYAGEWDVLRPAKEVEGMNILAADQLAELMREAETIIEGWKAS
ncbi:MAG: recombinase family protein [Clostridia bacterium]|nr:recombinase family protein [Clostridia bacterium]